MATTNQKPEGSHQLAADFVFMCLQAASFGHMAHFMTRSRSDHLAFSQLYNEIHQRVDAFAENYMGGYQCVLPAPSMHPVGFTEPMEMINHLKAYVEENRYSVCDDSSMQNQIDEIVALLNSVLYQLQSLS